MYIYVVVGNEFELNLWMYICVVLWSDFISMYVFFYLETLTNAIVEAVHNNNRSYKWICRGGSKQPPLQRLVRDGWANRPYRASSTAPKHPDCSSD